MFQANESRNRQVLDNNDIMKYAPSVFARQAHHEVSSQYRFIPTHEMVETLQAEGWQCVQAGEHRVRSASKKGYQKHMLRFRNPRLSVVGGAEVDLVVFNAHDRTAGFKFAGGMYKFLCANGLMVGNSLFDPVSVRHIGYKADNVLEASYRLIDAVPRIADTVNAMAEVTLSKDEQMHYANAALVAKFGQPEEGKRIEVRPEVILRPRRQGDMASDLWTTFNVVQENLVRGGQRSVNASRNGYITTRPVSSITENAKLNQALWTLAESMKQLKAA